MNAWLSSNGWWKYALVCCPLVAAAAVVGICVLLRRAKFYSSPLLEPKAATPARESFIFPPPPSDESIHGQQDKYNAPSSSLCSENPTTLQPPSSDGSIRGQQSEFDVPSPYCHVRMHLEYMYHGPDWFALYYMTKAPAMPYTLFAVIIKRSDHRVAFDTALDAFLNNLPCLLTELFRDHVSGMLTDSLTDLKRIQHVMQFMQLEKRSDPQFFLRSRYIYNLERSLLNMWFSRFFSSIPAALIPIICEYYKQEPQIVSFRGSPIVLLRQHHAYRDQMKKSCYL